MGRMQRDKGARFEREVAALLQPAFPEARRRSTGEESQEARGRDLKGTPGWCFQCQHGIRPNIGKKLSEAVAAAGQGEIPCAVTKANRGPILATLELDYLVRLMVAGKQGW